MRSRRSVQADVAEVARRRLELLSAELAEIRPDPGDPPSPGVRGGSGEPSESSGRQAGRHGPGTERLDGLTDPAAGGVSPSPGPGRHAHRGVGLRASVAGWAGDRLPPVMQGRARLGGSHLVVVLLTVLAAGVLTWWWVGRGGEQTVPTVDPAAPLVTPETAAVAPSRSGSPSVSPAASPGGVASAASGSGSGSGSGSVVVDVVGKVRRPGIASLPPGSRVVDALHAVGGARHGVSVASLNLARVLVDGEQIVVGVAPPPGVAPSAASGAGPGGSSVPSGGASAVPMVNINTADQGLLEQLPGIGPVTARSILDYRAEKGSFSAVDELLEVSGIGDKTLAKIAPYCTI